MSSSPGPDLRDPAGRPDGGRRSSRWSTQGRRRGERPDQPGLARPGVITVAVVAPALALLVVPLVALVQRVPWSDMLRLATDAAALEALRVSLVVSTLAAGLAAVTGIPLGFLLARGRFRGRTLLRTLVLVPMVLPPVVGGTALLFALGRRGLVGQWLDQWFGIALPFTTAGAVVAAAFVALPFVVTSVENGIRGLDPGPEELAATLGASPAYLVSRVTFPLARPGILAGVLLGWARALGEFGATITFAGNSPGRTQTLPLAIFVALESDRSTALALSMILLVVSVVLLTLLRNQWFPAAVA